MHDVGNSSAGHARSIAIDEHYCLLYSKKEQCDSRSLLDSLVSPAQVWIQWLRHTGHRFFNFVAGVVFCFTVPLMICMHVTCRHECDRLMCLYHRGQASYSYRLVLGGNMKVNNYEWAFLYWLGLSRGMFRAVCHLLVNEWLPLNNCPVHLFREQPFSCTPRENIKTRMKLDTDKKTVVESWNQFVASLSSASVTYLQARRVRW